MATLYFDSSGASDNSGSSDNNAADLSGAAGTDAATVITLDGSPDLSGLQTSGDAQSTIYLAAATATNRKIFWITAFDNTAKTVTVDTAPASTGSTSAWKIGGQLNASGVVNGFNALRAGDTALLNTDISGAINAVVRYVGGGTTGWVRVIGKAGARRVFTNTGNGALLARNTTITARLYVENTELQSQGTGNAIERQGTGTSLYFLYNSRITDAGASGIAGGGGSPIRCVLSEITGCASHGINASGTCPVLLISSYVHDNAGNNIISNTSFTLIDSILERSTLQNVLNSGGDLEALIYGCTYYSANNSGYEENSATQNGFLIFNNNVFKDNGNAAGEANIEIASTANRIVIDQNNCVTIAGARGGDNVSGITLDASDITTDPLFVDADAAAGSRNFGLQSSSPAKGIPYTFLGGLSVSYKDLGAVQRQESASGGGGIKLAGRGGLAG